MFLQFSPTFLCFVCFNLALYILVYTLLYYYPTLLHKRKNLGKLRSNIGKIAHRGSRDEGLPENTKASFKDAVKAGTDIVELDVWLSTDKQAVVFHDVSFKRMTGNKRVDLVNKIKFEDYPSLVPPKNQDSRLDEYPRREWSKVPLFEEVLQLLPGIVQIILSNTRLSPY